VTVTVTAPGQQAVGRASLTWNLLGRGPRDIETRADWPSPVSPDWAWGGATGRGVRVCIVDSGVEGDHALVGRLAGSYAVTRTADGTHQVTETADGDSCGHGTACAGIVRTLAPDCELYSVRVLGQGFFGSGEALIAGLRWAVEQRFDVVNLSLSTTRQAHTQSLRKITDDAYFGRTLIVASAHNLQVESFPWRFSAVLSVGSHAEKDPGLFYYNPVPPVEFFAHGVDVQVPWLGGGEMRCSGNSFAAPHISGYCALILSKHPTLPPFQVKNVLYLTAANVGGRK